MNNEFSRVIDIVKIKPSGTKLQTIGSDDECQKLKNRLGVEGFMNLRMDVDITPWRKQGLRVEGVIEADIEQICGVSLETIVQHIEEPLAFFLLPEHLAKGMADDEYEDLPEILQNGRADIGEIAIQNLSLGISPYPRKNGVSLSYLESEDVDDDQKQDNPFAVLERLSTPKAD
ncbi:MAG: DUF177 domain-containing protein [Pseudomonadota bacterium]|nr:DUF177 domain-containing protein [Pseudomonadota bacterium]